MPTITEFLTDPEQGWTHGQGPEFYYPSRDKPHLHLQVKNASTSISGWPGFAAQVNGLWVTFEDGADNKALNKFLSEAKIQEYIAPVGTAEQREKVFPMILSIIGK